MLELQTSRFSICNECNSKSPSSSEGCCCDTCSRALSRPSFFKICHDRGQTPNTDETKLPKYFPKFIILTYASTDFSERAGTFKYFYIDITVFRKRQGAYKATYTSSTILVRNEWGLRIPTDMRAYQIPTLNFESDI